MQNERDFQEVHLLGVKGIVQLLTHLGMASSLSVKR